MFVQTDEVEKNIEATVLLGVTSGLLHRSVSQLPANNLYRSSSVSC